MQRHPVLIGNYCNHISGLKAILDCVKQLSKNDCAVNISGVCHSHVPTLHYGRVGMAFLPICRHTDIGDCRYADQSNSLSTVNNIN